MPEGMRPQDQAGAAPRREGSDIINLPNIITFLRLCAVPVAVWLVLHAQFLAGFWIFAAAGVSDAVDGWLARRRGPTALGGLMDPVADKALLVCMYVTLAAAGVLPDWLAILVVFRDLVIVGGAVTLRLIGNRMSLRPLRISKLNTALQIVLVAASLLTSGLGLAVPVLIGALVWAVAASTLASGAAYVWKAARG